MNIPRLILAIVAGFIVIFATDYLIHGVWLMPDYNATKAIWRPDAEMNARVQWMFIAQFLFAATFVIIWAKGFAGRSIGVACVIGLLMGIFQGAWALVDYVVIPMPGELAVKWFISGLAQVVLLAIVTALVYKPATVSRA
jgi:hypothetical protein